MITEREPGEARRRSVLVTGASSGIGHACVATLIENDFSVWASARTEQQARSLRDEFGSGVRTVVFDLTDDEAVRDAAARVVAAGPLYGLINNAGAALPGPLECLPIEQFEEQIDINLTGQLRVTQALLPALRAGAATWGDARIVIMGSLDARIVGPLFGPYAASKHALVGLADALRAELRPASISVSLLEPGAMATPIWRRGTGVLADLQPTLPDQGGPYRGMMRFARKHVSKLSRIGGSPDRVAGAVLQALNRSSPSPRRVVGIDAAIVNVLLKFLPQRAIYRLAAVPSHLSARRTAAGPQS